MPCHEVAEDWNEFPDILWEVDGILKKVELRTYEEGPSVLSAEELEASDAKMDEVEIQRLLSMGVLEEMDDGEDASSDVQAWMQEWKLEIDKVDGKRRSRLVAKEFRFTFYGESSQPC